MLGDEADVKQKHFTRKASISMETRHIASNLPSSSVVFLAEADQLR